MTEKTEIWKGDLLGFREIGATFTKLVQSVGADEPGSKVISIEAGFGRGKTFFRENWARELRAAGEIVVEIDARQSDHSGDPVVTFIGALVGALPDNEKTNLQKAGELGKKYGGGLLKGAAGMVFRSGAEHVIELFADDAGKMVVGNRLAEKTVEEVGEGLSKQAGELIAAQLQAEKARQELPDQLDDLRKALTKEKETERVVVLIDELDRCHPDYAITLLEAMKLVFDRPGYVFVLMVNSEHLERIAAHRFVGLHKEEDDEAREPYLDKFVDMRLKLPDGKIEDAARALALELPEPKVPFGEGPEFTIKRAAQVAADLAPLSGLSLRQIKRVLLRVELAVRAYQGTPVDVPLLVWLGFDGAASSWKKPPGAMLRRSHFTPEEGLKRSKFPETDLAYVGLGDRGVKKWQEDQIHHFNTNWPEFREVPVCRLRTTLDNVDQEKLDVAQVYDGLAPWYLSEHQDMLNQVHQLTAD